MKLKLKHVCDWRTKAGHQKLLRGSPGLKRRCSSKQQVSAKKLKKLQTRPLRSVASLEQQCTDFKYSLSRVTDCIQNLVLVWPDLRIEGQNLKP